MRLTPPEKVGKLQKTLHTKAKQSPDYRFYALQDKVYRADVLALEVQHGRVWDTAELSEEFTVEGFLAPFVVARRKSDGQRGSMEFQHSPRFYFNFVEYDG